jgi:hypothetical protein
MDNNIDMTASISLDLIEFSLPPLRKYSPFESQLIVTGVLNRLKESLGNEGSQEAVQEKSLTRLSSLLLVRFITRGVEATEETVLKVGDDSDGLSGPLVPRLAITLRDRICDFVMKDIVTRSFSASSSFMLSD